MKFIYTFGAATYGQIRQKFFLGRHPTAASGRINALRKAGYVQTFWHLRDEGPPHRCVKLREKAAPWVERLWKERIDNPIFEVNSLDRALCMNDLVLRLEKLKIFDRMLSHHILRGSSGMSGNLTYRGLVLHRCSGILEVKKKEEKFIFPIELELGTRTCEHYERKLCGYYQDGSIFGVLYLCTHKETMDAIAKVDAKVRRDEDSIVYLALASSVLEALAPLVFTSCTGTRIRFE